MGRGQPPHAAVDRARGALVPSYGYLESDWRREAIRTNLWVVPAAVTAAALVLFAVTYSVDRAAYDGHLQLPAWVLSGTADAARMNLTTVAAAVITVVGIVFSITIVAQTLASTQFGPRMLRNFVRDLGTQLTLGAFVATFCFAVITLVSVDGGPHGDFVPHLSITVALGMTLVDVGVLIYFLNHIATMIYRSCSTPSPVAWPEAAAPWQVSAGIRPYATLRSPRRCSSVVMRRWFWCSRWPLVSPASAPA